MPPNVMQQQAIAEGGKHLAEADKAVKTSFFKWKPDFELAAEQYDKAGNQFKLGKAYDKAITAFSEAAKSHKSYNALYHAAKSLENAAAVARDAKMPAECNKLLVNAAQYYRRHGSSDQAAAALEKAAKDAEKDMNPESAMTLYMEVVDIRETEDQVRRMKVPLDRAVQMSIRAGKLKMTMEYLIKEALLLTQLKDDPMLCRNWMARMIVALGIGDFSMAEQLFNEALTASTFATSDEMFACDEMLDAYDPKDQERLSECTKQQLFGFLSNDTALLARKLVAKGGTGRAAKKLEDLEQRMESPARSEPSPTPVAAPKTADPTDLTDPNDHTEEESPGGDGPAAAAVEPAPAAEEDSDDDDLL